MTLFAPDTTSPVLAAAFPSRIPDVEQIVYEAVKHATAHGLPNGIPALSFYADRDRSQREGLVVPVVRGWPAYPGLVPAIGVAAGSEGEDQQNQTQEGGFAGTAYAYEPRRFPAAGGLRFPDWDGGIRLPTKVVVGTADYYSQAIYAPIIVELIHENRDERDRLHNELARILFPLRTFLLAGDPQLKKITLDRERSEQHVGPPMVEEPFTLYVSIFTVHVQYETLEARDVAGADSVTGPIDVAVTATDTRG